MIRSMAQALLFGAVASAALVVGAAIGARFDLPEHAYAVLLGFAAGAVLASLAATVMPEAFEHGGPFVAFATVAGFLLSYVVALE